MIALQSLALFLLLPALLGFLVSKHQSRRRKKKISVPVRDSSNRLNARKTRSCRDRTTPTHSARFVLN